VAPSAQAAKELQKGSGINSSTTTKLLLAVEEGRETLTSDDVLVLDEAGMVSTQEMYRFYELARDKGFKLILMGDDRQLEPVPTPCVLSEMIKELSESELVDIRRQKDPELGIAVMKLFRGGVIPNEKREEFVTYLTEKLVESGYSQEEATAKAIESANTSAFKDFDDKGLISEHENKTQLEASVVSDWHDFSKKSVGGDWANADGKESPFAQNIMLAKTNASVATLNAMARQILKDEGFLDESKSFTVETNIDGRLAEKDFCLNDRVMFRAGDPSGEGRFTNSTTATITDINGSVISGITSEGINVTADLDSYKQIDHAYAMTIHKAQGMTVENCVVLDDGSLVNREIYVAWSRFKEAMHVHTLDKESLESRCENERSKGNTISQFEELQGVITPEMMDKLKSYSETQEIDIETVREVVSRIGEAVEEIKMNPVNIPTREELEEKIDQAAAMYQDSGKSMYYDSIRANFINLAGQGFVEDKVVGTLHFMERKRTVDGQEVTDKLQANLSDVEGWRFQMKPGDRESDEVIRGANVDFIKHETGKGTTDAAAFIHHTNQAYVMDLQKDSPQASPEHPPVSEPIQAPAPAPEPQQPPPERDGPSF